MIRRLRKWQAQQQVWRVQRKVGASSPVLKTPGWQMLARKGILWREAGRSWQGDALNLSLRPCPASEQMSLGPGVHGSCFLLLVCTPKAVALPISCPALYHYACAEEHHSLVGRGLPVRTLWTLALLRLAIHHRLVPLGKGATRKPTTSHMWISSLLAPLAKAFALSGSWALFFFFVSFFFPLLLSISFACACTLARSSRGLECSRVVCVKKSTITSTPKARQLRSTYFFFLPQTCCALQLLHTHLVTGSIQSSRRLRRRG